MSDINLTLAAPTDSELLAEAEAKFDGIQTWATTCDAEYEAGASLLRSIKAQHKTLDERRKAITRPLDATKKQVMDLFRPALDYLSTAERTIKRSMLTYEEEQQRKQREEMARLQEAARREREKLEAQAARAREKGKEERAQALEQRADETLAAPVAVQAPKAEGTSTRTTYKAQVTDIDALIAAVAAGTVPREALQVNQKFLDQMARAMKMNLAYPGVRVVPTKTMGVRA